MIPEMSDKLSISYLIYQRNWIRVICCCQAKIDPLVLYQYSDSTFRLCF